MARRPGVRVVSVFNPKRNLKCLGECQCLGRDAKCLEASRRGEVNVW